MAYIMDFSTMIVYLITLIISFLGLFVGATLAFIAPKELVPGRKYFLGMQNAMLVFIICLLLYAYGAPMLLLGVLAFALSLTLYFTTDTTPINQIAYFLLGIIFYFSTKTTDVFVATAILIFLYGLPLGTLYVDRHIKESRAVIMSDMLLKYFLFIVLALLTHILANKVMTSFPGIMG